MLQHTDEDLDKIGDIAYRILSYLEIAQIYLEYCEGTYSSSKVIVLIDDMILMIRQITEKF